MRSNLWSMREKTSAMASVVRYFSVRKSSYAPNHVSRLLPWMSEANEIINKNSIGRSRYIWMHITRKLFASMKTVDKSTLDRSKTRNVTWCSFFQHNFSLQKNKTDKKICLWPQFCHFTYCWWTKLCSSWRAIFKMYIYIYIHIHSRL